MSIQTPEWVKDAVFYQIFPDRFAQSRKVAKPSNLEPWASPPNPYGFKGGDLLGVAEKLDYLKELGITAIYLTPIFASAANHRYHTHDYMSVDPILGGDAALAKLLKQAHRRGMKVVLDGVFNHASRGFYQFHHALENGAVSPYLDWFHFDRKHLKKGLPLNAYPRDNETLGYKAWWGIPALPKFNTKTPAVREFIFGVAEHWLRFGIDGWRLDAPHEIDDDAFWQEFRFRVKAVNPEAYVVGEIWVDARRWLQGDQFDAVMNYLFAKATLAYFCDRLDMAEVKKTHGYPDVRLLDQTRFTAAMDRILGLYVPAVTMAQMNLLDSHDTPRFLTLAQGDETALRLAAALMFTFPGAPCVYYGDEIGMEGRVDPDCRRSFPWDRKCWNHGLRDFFKRFISLRRTYPALRRGSFERLYAQEDVYAFCRKLGRETLLVALNRSRGARTLSLPVPRDGMRRNVFQDVWSRNTYVVKNNRIEGLSLTQRSSLILRRV